MIADCAELRLAYPLIQGDSCLIGKFDAMGCPCEIVMDTQGSAQGRTLLEIAIGEARRIERKFSRYRPDSLASRINHGDGRRLELDAETAHLLDYADSCFEMSDGLFDITTGVLRKIWRFDGSSQNVKAEDVEKILPFVGWQKIRWERPFLEVPKGMELDLGGICKEYAADRILQLLTSSAPISMLVNLGGDIAAGGERLWVVGIEDVERPGVVSRTVRLRQGGLATSGGTKRFARVDGKMRAHILDPRSGRPVAGPPRSVTVAAPTCTEAGFLSTMAMLHGSRAEAFLEDQEAEFWCHR